MKYAIADIHGCYRQYQALLQKIHFGDEDELYVLGDVADRGPEPIRVLQDMMLRPNVYPILGNHEYMALTVLERLNVTVTAENAESYLQPEDLLNYMHWMQDGGDATVRQFRALDAQERAYLLEYLNEFSLYEEAEAGGRRYVMVHAGLHGFREGRPLEEYAYRDFLFYRADYQKRYFSEERTCLVTGHTPTPVIRADGQPLVYEAFGHIALDCGCVFGGRLAAYCLDTGAVFYVAGPQNQGKNAP